MNNSPYADLEIRSGVNERGKYEVVGINESGEQVCYYETLDYSGAIMATHFAELYRFLDFITNPNDYIDAQNLSLMMIEKAAARIRSRIDSEIEAAGFDLRYEFLKGENN